VVVSFVAVLELMKRQLVGVANIDSDLDSRNSIDNVNTEVHQLALEWLA